MLHALFNAQTYASVERSAFEELSPEPGFDTKSVPLLKIHARIRRAQLTLKVGGGQRPNLSDKVFLYRVDRENPVRIWDWPAGDKTLTVDYVDTDVKEGETYAYVLYSPFQLITSPIRLTLSPVKASLGVPTTTLFIIDCSGSMGKDTPDGQQKLEAAKTAARHYLDVIDFDASDLGANHLVAMVSFSDSAYPTLNFTRDISQAREALTGLTPLARTNFGEPLDLGLSWLEGLPGEQRRGRKFIILLSDGMTNTGPVSRDEFLVDTPDQFANPLRLYQRLQSEGICTYSVGFGDPAKAGSWLLSSEEGLDEEVLRRIAEVPGTGGSYFTATDAFGLDRVYVRGFHDATGNVVFESTGVVTQGERKLAGQFNPARPQAPQTAAAATRPWWSQDIPLLVSPVCAAEPANSQMLVTLGWSSGALGLELKDPSGKIVDASYPGVHMRQSEQPICIAVDSPKLGNWTATVIGENIPAGESRYHLIASARVPPAASVGGVGGGGGSDWQTALLISSLVGTFVLSVMCVAIVMRRRRFGVARPAGAGVKQLAWLQVHEPGLMPRNFPMTVAVIRLGRDPGNDIVLSDPKISAFHAELRNDGGQVAVIDLGSKNGTWVGNERVDYRTLRSGDQIRLGDTVAVFSLA